MSERVITKILVKAGAVEPTSVTRGALQNAASISGGLLTTEAAAVAFLLAYEGHGRSGLLSATSYLGRHRLRQQLVDLGTL